jgi:hypothetical protein
VSTNTVPPAPTTQAEFKDRGRRLRAEEAARVVKELEAVWAGGRNVLTPAEQIAHSVQIYAALLIAGA